MLTPLFRALIRSTPDHQALSQARGVVEVPLRTAWKAFAPSVTQFWAWLRARYELSSYVHFSHHLPGPIGPSVSSRL